MYKTWTLLVSNQNSIVRRLAQYYSRYLGVDYLKDNSLNKNLAFTLEERQALGIHGLLAAQFRTMEEQINVCKLSLSRFHDNLNKYIYLSDLQETNEKLFYNVLNDDLESLMPIVYTPTVGTAILKFGLVYRKPRGLFITIHDKGNIAAILRNWITPRVRAICFTDSENILGLGDLGAYGMALPVGKLTLYTAIGGIPPNHCLPIALDVGTDCKRFLDDPLYIGLRIPRVKGQEYEDFMDEFMMACRDVYGPACLLQSQNFSEKNSFRLLNRYKDSHCTFNDDIQGSAAVAIAGLLAAQRITKKLLCQHVYLFYGAGMAAIGLANLLVDALIEEGVSRRDAQKKIWMFDEHGLLSTRRKHVIPEHALVYAKNVPAVSRLTGNFIATCKATVLLGVSSSGGSFTSEVLTQMAKNAARPIIFALSNPAYKAECTPQQAYNYTQGRCIYASGSPFPLVKYNGRVFQTSRANTCFIFPGLALGVTSVWARHVTDNMFLTAAKVVAKSCKEKDLEEGKIYPPVSDIKKVALDVAVEVANLAYQRNLACRYSKPKDMRSFIEKKLYNLQYTNYVHNKARSYSSA